MDNKKNTSVLVGRVPPQAVDLEKAIIGALLVDSKAMDSLTVGLQEDFFYVPKHKTIYKAISSLFAGGNPIDLLTVSQWLKSKKLLEKAGGDIYLVGLSQEVASSANIDFHAKIVIDKFIKRKLITVSNEVIKRAYDEAVTPLDLLEFASSNLDKVDDNISTDFTAMTWKDAISQIPEHVQRLTENDGLLTGVDTGLTALNNHFSGWQKQDFIVIGADSGMGKTALVMCSMLAAAKSGAPVGMFSMEMSVKQLALRGVAVESNFHMNQLMRTGFEKAEYFDGLWDVVNRMSEYPIHIDDKPALTVAEMKRKARGMKRKFGLELLVIDFLQMFSGDKDTRINISEAARECKNLAKELDIPVIGLSQISREVHKSKYSLPKKRHLKEASAIEEAADVIGMLYRPSYYGYTEQSYPDLWEELGLIGDENAALIVEKNRNGSMGAVGLKFLEDKTKYVDGCSTNQNFV